MNRKSVISILIAVTLVQFVKCSLSELELEEVTALKADAAIKSGMQYLLFSEII